MKRAITFAILFALALTVSCGSGGETYYAAVDQLNVREEADPEMDAFTTLAEGEAVTYLGEDSELIKSYTIRGKEYTDNFMKVRLESGEEGWVFASAMSPTEGFVLPDYTPDGELTVEFTDELEDKNQYYSAVVIPVDEEGIEATGDSLDEGMMEITISSNFLPAYQEVPANFEVDDPGEYWIILAGAPVSEIYGYFQRDMSMLPLAAMKFSFDAEKDATVKLTSLSDFDYFNRPMYDIYIYQSINQ